MSIALHRRIYKSKLHNTLHNHTTSISLETIMSITTPNDPCSLFIVNNAIAIVAWMGPVAQWHSAMCHRLATLLAMARGV